MRRFIQVYRQRCEIVWSVTAAVLVTVAVLTGEARCERRLVDQDQAARLGLTRAWFTQVQLNAGHSRVERAALEGDRLTVLTNAGMVQELDALTGKTYWTAPI